MRRVFLNRLTVKARRSPNAISRSGFLVRMIPSKPWVILGIISLRMISRKRRLSLLRFVDRLEIFKDVMMVKRETLRLFFASRTPRFPTKKDLPRLCTASMSDRLARRLLAASMGLNRQPLSSFCPAPSEHVAAAGLGGTLPESVHPRALLFFRLVGSFC